MGIHEGTPLWEKNGCCVCPIIYSPPSIPHPVIHKCSTMCICQRKHVSLKLFAKLFVSFFNPLFIIFLFAIAFYKLPDFVFCQKYISVFLHETHLNYLDIQLCFLLQYSPHILFNFCSLYILSASFVVFWPKFLSFIFGFYWISPVISVKFFFTWLLIINSISSPLFC